MRHFEKGVVFLLAGALSAPAFAAGTKIGDFEINSNMSLATDYASRGLTSSDAHPAIQGGGKISHNTGLYVNLWGSSVNPHNTALPSGAQPPPGKDATVEFDIYGGFAYEISPGMSLDAGILYYKYPGADKSLELDYKEFYLGGSYKIREVGLSAKYSYSNDFGGVSKGLASNKSAYYAESAMTYDLPYETVLAVHYGHSAGDHFKNSGGKPDNYDDYSVGASKEILGFVTDVSFYGTDRAGLKLSAQDAENRVVLKLTKNF